MAAKKDPWQTPAMRQYKTFKDRHTDCVLFFRMGDFYELFGDDAELAARTLGITLTQRSAGLPMAGVPQHSVDGYLRRMIEAGHRVAVCDQIEDPKDVKGVVERAVTRIITPGTLVEESLLADGEANTLGAIAFLEDGDNPGTRVALAVVEVSTGVFTILETSAAEVPDELASRSVRELIVAETATGDPPPRAQAVSASLGVALTTRPAWEFRFDEAMRILCDHYGVSSLEGFGLADDDLAIPAAGAIIRYLRAAHAMDGGAASDTEKARERFREHVGERSLAHLAPPKRENDSKHLQLDAQALRSLEIERTIKPTGQDEADGSLSSLFSSRSSRCVTPMGRRLVREWLRRPLADIDAIGARHSCIRTLVGDRVLGEELAEVLSRVQDVPRIVARVALNRASPRDVVALGRSLVVIDVLAECLEGAPAFARVWEELISCREALSPIAARIERECVDDPPSHLREGGLIRDGIDAELDEARRLQRDAGEWLAEYQAQLVEQHDLPSLKVGYNKVFGYYIELPVAQARRAPDVFTRKQTLKNAERYITPELKSFEDKVLTAGERAVTREQALFSAMCVAIREQASTAGVFANAVAEIDVLRCFADRAVLRGWVEPEFVDKPGVLDIKEGRHPVLEELLGSEFVANDIELGDENGSLALITGPNMAGKSTYIRQVALITLLAHAGSFVPCQSARLGLCDRIFTRIGADDALHRGQSTFMVEMTETARVLHGCTELSLVILDEIGRGTSTLDGLSLAWAIAERLAGIGDQTAPRPRTLFATHYHELTSLSDRHPELVRNLHVQVREFRDEIVFLHRVASGAATASFGVQVARLAGVPGNVIERARELLESLRVSHAEVDHQHVPEPKTSATSQMGLFTEFIEHPVVGELRELKIESMSPLQAFDELRRLTDRARKATSSEESWHERE
ncbi:MAG: DNA mismatch repair protein MutS [Planctomycetota bacterium]